jgi:hypothetical protein
MVGSMQAFKGCCPTQNIQQLSDLTHFFLGYQRNCLAAYRRGSGKGWRSACTNGHPESGPRSRLMRLAARLIREEPSRRPGGEATVVPKWAGP